LITENTQAWEHGRLCHNLCSHPGYQDIGGWLNDPTWIDTSQTWRQGMMIVSQPGWLNHLNWSQRPPRPNMEDCVTTKMTDITHWHAWGQGWLCVTDDWITWIDTVMQ
jgi:hypothetical protein